VQLSVVVPVFNVAEYLAASLDSILRQKVRDVEVIVVDDGSTDGSAEIAAEYAAGHDAITLIRQANSGVSIARNVAIPHCRGEFLTFVDPDDELPADAWSAMLRTLRRTRSDFVVGKAERLHDDRRFVTPLMQRNHEVERLRVTIDEMPLMLADVFVWNKIFTREFWERAAVHFPEWTRYQDQPALTQAFLAARSFDVLTDVVYDWRVRGDLSSATQKRRDLDNLHERVNTKRMTVEMVRDHGNDEVTRVLLTEILPIDMWEHFWSVRGCTDDYWQVLRDAVREFWAADTVPFEATRLPVQQRMMGVLVAQGRREDLLRLLDFIEAHGVATETVDGRVEGVLPFRDDAAIPREAFVLAAHERPAGQT
jgi:glycosyltransferase involved in cell wall biosynthesis